MSKNLDITLLLDFYGDMLTDKQRSFISYYYNEDLSLSEIAANDGITRQGVHDNLSRTEALLRNMEAKTGCVGRDQACRKAVRSILDAAAHLQEHKDPTVSTLAGQIISAAKGLEE